MEIDTSITTTQPPAEILSPYDTVLLLNLCGQMFDKNDEPVGPIDLRPESAGEPMEVAKTGWVLKRMQAVHGGALDKMLAVSIHANKYSLMLPVNASSLQNRDLAFACIMRKKNGDLDGIAITDFGKLELADAMRYYYPEVEILV